MKSYWLHFKHIHHASNRALYVYWLPHLLTILCISTIVHMHAFVNLILKNGGGWWCHTGSHCSRPKYAQCGWQSFDCVSVLEFCDGYTDCYNGYDESKEACSRKYKKLSYRRETARQLRMSIWAS